jgi:Zn-finger nucleic acid-binding protein
MIHCPKCKQVELTDNFLGEKLAVKHCRQCEGSWIPSNNYEIWVHQQSDIQVTEPENLSRFTDINYSISVTDSKAGLCPECKRYLSRVKLPLKREFYVEKCMSCGGIWCDGGEWNVLSQVGLNTTIDHFFSVEWQARIIKTQQHDKEKEATINKLGLELAQKVFDLAEILEKHPNGDFGVAYLMRRFDK